MSSNDAQYFEFNEILEIPLRNGVNKPRKVRGSGYKMVNMGELFANPIIRDIEMERVPLSEHEYQNNLLKKGDLLFARQSLTVEGAGKCSLFESDEKEVTFEGHLIRARLNQEVADPKYLFYYFQSHNGTGQIRSIVTVTAAAGIRSSDLGTLEIPLPSIETQKRIAGILSALDEKIELNRQTNATLEAIAQAIFKEWFVNEEVTSDWELVALPEIIDLNPRRYLKRDELAPYLDMANMPTEGHRAIEWREREFSSGTRFANGDTLLARITPCLENGKTAFVDFLTNDEVGWGSTEFIVLRPKTPFPPAYGYYLARSKELRKHAILNMVGSSGRQRVPTSSFDNFLIPLPPIELAEKFGGFAENLMNMIRANDNQSRTLAKIRDTLLPKLMRGEVIV